MNVLVIGGTGFIGYHIVELLTRQNFSVTILSRNSQSQTVNQNNIRYIKADIDVLSANEISAVLSGIDAIIFSAGADDRTLTSSPAYDFFYKKNVLPVLKIGEAVKNSTVKKFIIIGSYFSWLHRNNPLMKLSEKHDYIKSRTEQLKQGLSFANDKLSVIVLELPYVFGVYPYNKVMWAPLIRYANTTLPFLFFTSGGTSVVSVRNVAQSVYCCLVNAIPSGAYPLADKNLTWVDMLTAFRNDKSISIVSLNKWLLLPFAYFVEWYLKIANRQSGLKPSSFLDIQCSNTFIAMEECLPGFKANATQLYDEIRLMVNETMN